MDQSKYLILLIRFFTIISIVKCNTYSVKVGTEHHVNVVDERFLSFTVDPKYLFSSSKKYNSQESTCMASSLSPAYIRIAGPSTSHMTFHNSTITFTDLSGDLSDLAAEVPDLKVMNWQWRRFVQWAKSNDFDLVFALNNEDKMESGLWDPNTALNILTVAEKAGVEKIFWQLGYECHNQTIEEYLNDLETLRVMSETFPAKGWGVVGGDVTSCLGTSSKSDFKDYVILSDDLLDAVLLQGNSSAQELERMSDSDRLKLLKRLSQSSKPLWLTESAHFTEALDTAETALNRAADWMSSLGYSARNGFSVHFRELDEEELYEPTLSFYMALLYKNLVGERVLHVDLEASEAVLFAHCASLRHKPVSGAVTFYGANLDDEPARFAIKLPRREEGGDVMQFILGLDGKRNIMVNGRPMQNEGDLRPVVKRLRPYRTLLINLPPKSFGFWVLANTNIEACHIDSESAELVEDLSATVDKIDDATISDKLDSDKILEDEVNDDETVEDTTDKNDIVEDEVDNAEDREEKIKDSYKVHADEDIEVNETEKNDTENNDNYKENNNKDTKKYVESKDNKTSEENVELDEFLEDKEESRKVNNLKNRINSLNDNINNVHKLIETKSKKINERNLKRMKRHIADGEDDKKKYRKQIWKSRQSDKSTEEPKPKFEIIKRLLSISPKSNLTRQFRIDRSRKLLTLNRNRISKRHLIAPKVKSADHSDKTITHERRLSRKPRSASNENQYSKKNVNLKDEHFKDSLENEIDSDNEEQIKLLKILRKIHEELKDLPVEDDDNTEYLDYGNGSKDEEQIMVRTKVSDDSTVSEKSKKGLLKTTIGSMVGVLTDLNKNLKKFWSALNILE